MKQKINYNFSSQQVTDMLQHISADTKSADMMKQLMLLEEAAVKRRYVKSISYTEKSNMFYMAGSAWGNALNILVDLSEEERLILLVKKVIPLCKDSAFYSFKDIVDNKNDKIYETYLIRELIALSFCCVANNYSYLDAAKQSLFRVVLNICDNIGKIEAGLLLLKISNMARADGCSDISAKIFYEFAVYNLKDAYYADSIDLKISEAYHQALLGFQDGLLATQHVALDMCDKESYDACVKQLQETVVELQNFVKIAAISDGAVSDDSSVTLNTTDISDNSYATCEVSEVEHEEVYTQSEAIEYVIAPRGTLRYRKRF